MKKVKKWSIGVVLLVLAILLAGCNSADPVTEQPQKTTRPTLVAPPALSVELKDLLTLEEVGDAIGCTVSEPMMWEHDTWAVYKAADPSDTTELRISMAEETRGWFDQQMSLIPEKLEVPHLGEVSWLDPANNALMTYESGVVFSVELRYAEETDTDKLLMATRHLTALLLDRALG